MKLVLDDIFNDELIEYLLGQEGIEDVTFKRDDFLTTLDIKYDEKMVPELVLKYIELFQNRKYSILFEFDKGTNGEYKTLKYTIDDMCCEYCYKGLVSDLFDNENVKSVKSNFDFQRPAFNIEFIIEYDEKYPEKELIKFLKEKNN